MNNRRDFLVALGGVLALPRLALAQQAGRTYRVGWLSASSPRTETYSVAFVERLRELVRRIAWAAGSRRPPGGVPTKPREMQNAAEGRILRELDREIRRLRPLEDLVHVGGGAAIQVRKVRAIGHKAPGIRTFPPRV